jgi:hypothetical protein
MSISRTQTRLGAIALAVAGVLFFAYPAVRPYHDETTLGGATASMGSNAWVAAHLFAMVGFVLLPLGLLALQATLASRRSAGLARIGLVATWIGAGLSLPYYGAEDFGLHAIAGPKGSQSHVLALVDAVRNQPVAITMFGIGLVLIAIGAIVTAVAVWRSQTMPRASAVLYGVGFALFLPQFFGPATIRIAHGVLLAVGLFVLAAALWTRPTRATADADGGDAPNDRNVATARSGNGVTAPADVRG